MIALRRPALALACLLALAPTASATHDDPKLYSRIYLLADDSGFLYWGVDPDDPELGSGVVERFCEPLAVGGTPGSTPCNFFFLPASLLAEDATWTSAKPLQFRLALEIETPGSATVRLEANGMSGAATESSPEVWTGTIGGSGKIPAATWSTMRLLVTREVPQATISLRTAGASYIDLPTPVPARAVPELLGRSPSPKPGAGALDTDLRSFRFNDAEWSVTKLTGDLQQARSFDVEVDRDAVLVMAWVELFDRPFLHDVVRGRDPDSRKLTDSPRTELLRGGEQLARGYNPGLYGLGMDSLAALDVPAGPVTLSVTPTTVWPTSYQQGHPYEAYVLEVYGERTLRSMRWASMFADYPGLGPTNAPAVAHCPGTPPEIVPVTGEVTTVSLDMDHDSVAPLSDWALSFLLPPNSWFLCAEVGNGDDMRFTFPGAGIRRVGATVSNETTYSEWRATAFEFEAHYAYTPPPPPPDEDPHA